jgi:TMEM175 potassium channel family protein
VSSAGSHSVSRDTTRLVGFSDAVFAITITLLVLEIKPPSDYTNLLHDLAALWPSYLAYAVTFLFIGQVGDSTARGRRQSRGASSSLSRGSP